MKTRRDFCADVCKAAALGGAIGTLPSCGGGGGGGGTTGPTSGGVSATALTRISAAVSGGAATVNVDGASPLANTGAMALVQAGNTSLLVTRTGATTFTALTAICTHEQCEINGSNSGRFVCPCHGSIFSTTGSVITGPAISPLRNFATSFAGTTLTITLS